MITEYTLERSETALTLRRTRAWLLSGLAGALFPLAAMIWMIQEAIQQPIERFSLLTDALVFCATGFVFYKLLIWGRCLVFDRQNNTFSIDGRKICALSDLALVQMEGSQRSSIAPNWGRLRALHFRTVQEKDITLKFVWENSLEHRNLVELAAEIANFADIPHE